MCKECLGAQNYMHANKVKLILQSSSGMPSLTHNFRQSTAINPCKINRLTIPADQHIICSSSPTPPPLPAPLLLLRLQNLKQFPLQIATINNLELTTTKPFRIHSLKLSTNQVYFPSRVSRNPFELCESSSQVVHLKAQHQQWCIANVSLKTSRPSAEQLHTKTSTQKKGWTSYLNNNTVQELLIITNIVIYTELITSKKPRIQIKQHPCWDKRQP